LFFFGSGYSVADVEPLIIFAYLLYDLAIYSAMQSFSECLVNFPTHGSFISYTKEFIRDTFACRAGSTYWICWLGYAHAGVVLSGIV
jgi:AAT family amino acid transporter